MQDDIQEMKSGVTGRLLNLESNAAEKVVVSDHEDRIRSLERQRWLFTGAAGVVGALLSFALQLIH